MSKSYPTLPDLAGLGHKLHSYAQLKHEQGAESIVPILRRAERSMKQALRELRARPDDRRLRACEPDSLALIRKLRPPGPRRLWRSFDRAVYQPKIEGAILARAAGCTLGAIVEGWSVEAMRDFAAQIGDAFPPTDYWSSASNPAAVRYGKSRCIEYTRRGIRGVPVDDDLAYTLFGLLILEEFGPGFTTADAGRAWVRHLPVACTAEEIALANLKKGISAYRAGAVDNPYCQWIGADIRADPWAYAAPGNPELAAELAHRDAYLSHRRNGIYGAMFFAAAESAAFAVDDPVEAIRIGLTEIPRGCLLARDIRWALSIGPKIRDYRDARAAVDRRFTGMSWVHTNNNACLTIFGLMIGKKDVTPVLGQTVAMGLDNDCTTATAGGIVGAVVGKNGVPARWHRNFRNTIFSYLKGRPTFAIDDLVERFGVQAERVWRG